MKTNRYKLMLSSGRLLILCALALAGCTPADTPPPTTVPTQPPTAAATALPPTAVATAESTAFSPNIPVPATSAHFELPLLGLAVDAHDNLYLSTCYFGTGMPQILKVDRHGLLTVVAGIDTPGFSGDGGPARAAQLVCPTGLRFDHQGNLNFTDNHRILRIDQNGIITTVAGSGPVYSLAGDSAPLVFAGDGGPATSAQLTATDLAFDLDDNLYFTDVDNRRVRKVDKQGIITTVAGTGTPGFSGDGGPAAAAELRLDFSSSAGVSRPNPAGLAADALGQIYIVDSGNGRVRKIDQQGQITTIAGADGPALSGDGVLATEAVLAAPVSIAFDADGNLYLADTAGNDLKDNRIRKIDQKGIITTVVGTGQYGLSGDGGLATAADIAVPGPMAFDSLGNLYFIDTGNGRVRKVDTQGTITTVAGGAP